MTLAETIRQRVISELVDRNYNVSRTARALGISRRSFYRLLEKHRIALPHHQRWRMPGSDEEKTRARNIAKTAIKRGLKPLPCEVCQTTENIEAHHDDYSKPMAIRWLCCLHHVQWHADKRADHAISDWPK